MKNKILIAAALAFSLYAHAQSTCNNTCGQSNLLYADDKMAGGHHNLGNNTYSLINPQWKVAYMAEVARNAAKSVKAIVCYRMTGDKMFVVNNGISACMDKYITLQNGTMILPYGTLITRSGEIVHLKNNDAIDMEGTLINTQKANTIKEQAAL